MNQAGGIHAAMIAISMMLLLELKEQRPQWESCPDGLKQSVTTEGYQDDLGSLRQYARDIEIRVSQLEIYTWNIKCLRFRTQL